MNYDLPEILELYMYISQSTVFLSLHFEISN